MFDKSDEEERLRRLFQRKKGEPPENREELLARLMPAFDERYARKERIRRMSLSTRRALAFAAALGIVGVVACTAPVSMDVEVGRTVEVRYAAAQGPAPREVAEFLRNTLEPKEGGAQAAKSAGAPGRREVSLRVQNQAGDVTINAEIWGDGPEPGALGEKIRAAFPALSSAQIHEEVLHGKVKGTLAKKLGHDVLDLDVISEADVEKARADVIAELRARGVEGKVDVQIEGSGGERKVMIRVEQECADGGAGGAPPM